MSEEKTTELKTVKICSKCKALALEWDGGLICATCGKVELVDAITCDDCGMHVPFGKAHLCGKEVKDTRWQHLQTELAGANAPAIEEFEQAASEVAGAAPLSKRIPAEMMKREDILVGERYRREYTNIEQLAESIRVNGLLQYPVVDQNGQLIAGGRRLKALELLGWVWVPVVRKQNVDPLRLRELELEENIQREDMTWAEKVALKEEIYRLKVQMHGAKPSGRAATASTGVSQSDVAKLFGDSDSNFSLDLDLARAIKEIPQLAQCKNKDEARKFLKSMQEKLIVDELEKRHREQEAVHVAGGETGETAGAASGSNGKPTLYGRAEKAFIVMDALVGLRALPDNSPFGFVNVDTPYAIDLNSTKKTDDPNAVRIIEHDYREWDAKDFLTKNEDGTWAGLAYETAKEVFRVVDNCTMTWWFAMQWYQPLLEMLQAVGWKIDPIPCIWDAGNQGQTNQPELYLARTYEPFFVCRKGQPIINKRGRSNQFHFNKLTADKKIHPTEKPVELMEELYGTFAPLGCSILVPYLGSGNDLLAAYRTGRDGLGFDLNNEVKRRFLVRVAEYEGSRK